MKLKKILSVFVFMLWLNHASTCSTCGKLNGIFLEERGRERGKGGIGLFYSQFQPMSPCLGVKRRSHPWIWYSSPSSHGASVLLAGAPTDCVLEVSHLGALYSETRSTVADSLQLQSLQDPLWSSSWDQVPPTQPWPTSMCGRRDQSQCVLPSAEPLYWAGSALVFLVYIGFVLSDLHGSQTLPCQVLPLSSCSKPHAPKDSGCPQTLRAWSVGLPFPFKSLHSPRVGRL